MSSASPAKASPNMSQIGPNLQNFNSTNYTASKRKLYLLLVREKLLYPIIPLHACSKNQMSNMQHVQNRATRFITNSSRADHITSIELLRKTNLEPININLQKQAQEIWNSITANTQPASVTRLLVDGDRVLASKYPFSKQSAFLPIDPQYLTAGLRMGSGAGRAQPRRVGSQTHPWPGGNRCSPERLSPMCRGRGSAAIATHITTPTDAKYITPPPSGGRVTSQLSVMPLAGSGKGFFFYNSYTNTNTQNQHHIHNSLPTS